MAQNKRHIHYDLIIAWAEGSEIECLQVDNTRWMLVSNPQWNRDDQYRIKPREPRRFWVNVYHNGSIYGSYLDRTQGCINCRDGGETIEVVEVIEDD